MNWNAGDTQVATQIASPLIQGFGRKKAKDFEARQLKRQAQSIDAKGNREAYEIRRQGKIMASNARASMAGAGGTTTDVGATEQLSGIKQASDYNALTALFDANTQADGVRTEAKARKIEGRREMISGVTTSLSSVLKNSDKIFGKKKGKEAEKKEEAVRRSYNQKRGY